MSQSSIIIGNLDAMLTSERKRLVGLCARLTGNRDAAEDLAQETLLEAWRHIEELRDQERFSQWLSGIARNVCLRWIRKHGRDSAQLAAPPANQNSPLTELEDIVADDFDLEVELERKELADLLDRALALLPPETRAVLVARYIDESPIAEVAARLGLNTSSVSMRLQRGKLALRRLLITEMHHEIAPYHQHTLTEMWEETPLWCNLCGQQHLLGIYIPTEGKFYLRCPGCTPDKNEALSTNHLRELQGIKSFKQLSRQLAIICNRYYRTALHDGSIACYNCGRLVRARILRRDAIPPWVWEAQEFQWRLGENDDNLLSILCEECFTSWSVTLEGLVLALPEAQSFLRMHPRIHTLPRQELEVDGQPALLTSFESVTNTDRLDVISACDTFEVLRVYGDRS